MFPLFSPLRKVSPRILIVKTSSLGDILQAFEVLAFIKRRFPLAQIDWAVEAQFDSLVRAHPLIFQPLCFDFRGFKRYWRQKESWHSLWHSFCQLRKKRYDVVFDLQGNCKSGLIAALSRSKMKVGLSLSLVREWPNVLATHRRFRVPRTQNMRLQYLGILQQFFRDFRPFQTEKVRFRLKEGEKGKVEALLQSLPFSPRIMVCPGSQWPNKQLPLTALSAFLAKIRNATKAGFFLMWGAEREKAYCQELLTSFPQESLIVEKLSLPAWQNLMYAVDLVIAVDSSALHLCGTTDTPSFSIFGPTSPDLFKPMGERHFAFWGSCPYGSRFEKSCPLLRTCPTGACMREIDAEALFSAWAPWYANTFPIFK